MLAPAVSRAQLNRRQVGRYRGLSRVGRRFCWMGSTGRVVSGRPLSVRPPSYRRRRGVGVGIGHVCYTHGSEFSCLGPELRRAGPSVEVRTVRWLWGGVFDASLRLTAHGVGRREVSERLTTSASKDSPGVGDGTCQGRAGRDGSRERATACSPAVCLAAGSEAAFGGPRVRQRDVIRPVVIWVAISPRRRIRIATFDLLL